MQKRSADRHGTANFQDIYDIRELNWLPVIYLADLYKLSTRTIKLLQKEVRGHTPLELCE